MAEDYMTLPHRLTLDSRNKLTMTGVTEVISFDENTVILKTDMGQLTVQGKQLQLKTLSPDGGQVTVDGSVSALVYEEPRRPGSWKSRLFG